MQTQRRNSRWPRETATAGRSRAAPRTSAPVALGSAGTQSTSPRQARTQSRRQSPRGPRAATSGSHTYYQPDRPPVPRLPMTIPDTVGVEMNAWFEALGRRFADAAAARGARVASPELDPQVADEVLELARVAAHSKERRFAPLACFMPAGSEERLRQAGAAPAPERAAHIRTGPGGVEGQPRAGLPTAVPDQLPVDHI